MGLHEEHLFDELAYDEAEGAAESYDEDVDGLDDMDEADEYDEVDEWDSPTASFDEVDEMDDYETGDLGDDVDGYEDVDAYEDADLEALFADALSAEDTDEFLRRVGGFLRRAARGAVQVARRAAPIVGQIARTAAPLLRHIPHPAAQGAATIANLLGRLRMEGASEDEALEALAEYAARNPSAVPVVAGLAARALVRRAGPTLSPAARRRVVRGATQAARVLVQRQGPAAIRALPRVVRSVRRTAAVRRTPPVVRPRVALNTARRVAANPQLARRLSRPLPRGRAIVRRAVAAGGRGVAPGTRGGVPRSFVLRGPTRITLTPA